MVVRNFLAFSRVEKQNRYQKTQKSIPEETQSHN